MKEMTIMIHEPLTCVASPQVIRQKKAPHCPLQYKKLPGRTSNYLQPQMHPGSSPPPRPSPPHRGSPDAARQRSRLI